MKTESLLGFIFGAAVGAVAGVLFAPAKGEETRKKLMEAAAEGYEEVKEDFDELTHDAHVRYRRIEAGKLKKQLMEQGGELKEDARKALLAQIEKLEAALAKEEAEETLAEEQA